MTKRCLLFLLLAISGFAYAQLPTDSSKYLYLQKGNHHALGINLGFTTGAGLSYRFKRNWWAIEAAAMPWFVKYDGVGVLSLGLSNYVYLRQSEKLSVFLCLGVHDYTKKTEMDYYVYNEDKTNAANQNRQADEPPYSIYEQVTKHDRTHTLNIGFGPGLEVPMCYDLNFHVMVGYAAYDILDDPRTFLTLDLGFCYYFR